MRRPVPRLLARVLLAATQLPMLGALVLAWANPGSDHEFRSTVDGGKVRITLHHVEAPRPAHHHTGIESVLVRAGDGEHPDHQFCFGSDSTATKPPVNEDPAADAGVLPASASSACLPADPAPGRCGDRSLQAAAHLVARPFPVALRRGTVMRL